MSQHSVQGMYNKTPRPVYKRGMGGIAWFFGPIRFRLLAIQLVLILIYLVLAPVQAQSMYYALLFQALPFPLGNYHDTRVAGVEAEDIFFTAADQSRLHGWYFDVSGSKHLVLVHHGRHENVSVMHHYIDAIIRSGASVCVYDYRGFGRSAGSPSISGICEDGEAALAYLIRDKHWLPNQIVHVGVSLGSGPASEIAAKFDSAGVILISPFTSLRTVCRDKISWLKLYPDFLWPERDIGPIQFVCKQHPPILILHGVNDADVPISHSEQLTREGKAPLQLVKLRCGHAVPGGDHSTLLRSIRQFIEQLELGHGRV